MVTRKPETSSKQNEIETIFLFIVPLSLSDSVSNCLLGSSWRNLRSFVWMNWSNLTTWGGSHFSSFYPFYGVAFPTLKRAWPFLLKLFATTMTGVKASLQVIESFMKVLRLLLNFYVNDTTTCPRIRLHFRHKMGQEWKWRKIECLPVAVHKVR